MSETTRLRRDAGECKLENNTANTWIVFHIGKYLLYVCHVMEMESSQADNGPLSISKSIYSLNSPACQNVTMQSAYMCITINI